MSTPSGPPRVLVLDVTQTTLSVGGLAHAETTYSTHDGIDPPGIDPHHRVEGVLG